jgi:mycoredoxin-dependent peroxiredoxin
MVSEGGIQVGDEAPDFELRDQHGQPVRLSDYRGKKAVVLVFYPFAFTKTCQGELCSLRDDLGTFANEEAQLLTVSVDSPAAHRAWGEQQGYTFPLLADFWPHGEVARAYGVFDERFGVALRGTFVIDTEGVVRYRVVNPISEARDQEEVAKVLAELG